MTPTIAVFGDNFYDRYIIGSAHRVSPEAPIPVVSVEDERIFPGGAGNVVANLDALGAKVLGVDFGICKSVKNRLVVGDYQLARWDENDTQDELDPRMFGGLKADAVIISDYGKGSITYSVIEAIAALHLPTFIDSKRDPRDFDIVTDPTFFPNQKEWEKYMFQYRLQPKVVVKRGADGIEYQEFGKVVAKYASLARRVVSVCGAGDTVIAAYTFASVQRSIYPDPLAFANKAAGVVVGKPYTATVGIEEVDEFGV